MVSAVCESTERSVVFPEPTCNASVKSALERINNRVSERFGIGVQQNSERRVFVSGSKGATVGSGGACRSHNSEHFARDGLKTQEMLLLKSFETTANRRAVSPRPKSHE